MHSMGNHLLNILILLLLTTCAPHANCSTEITDEERTAIENGLAVGNDLAEALKDGNFADSLVKLGTNVAPFLGVLGPLAEIVLAFIPSGDSTELVSMRAQIEEVNENLDFITAKYTEVKNSIDESTVVVSYGIYEQKIRAAEEKLNRVYRVEGQTRETEKENFIIQYESDFDNSVQDLYDIMMYNGNVISENIYAVVLQQTKHHRRKIVQFCLGMVQLLLQGIKVKVSYYGIKEWASDQLVTEWETKMSNLRDNLQSVNAYVKSNSYVQMHRDSKDLLLRYHGLGNQGLMDKLYNFLTEKYDWRFWFVAVYNAVGGLDNHSVWHKAYTGITFIRKHGKNTIIAGQNKNLPAFIKSDMDYRLPFVTRRTLRDSKLCDNEYNRAYALLNTMISRSDNSGESGYPFTLLLALRTNQNHNLVYRSLESHRAVRQIHQSTTCCYENRPSCLTEPWHYIMIVFG